ncbi:BlaI/MecI/CopY family transcriptional regulator [Litorilituus lipolyticus]|uniref:BlaI/MecI/CopY family transcriptional regulator n=1 Tax=Litorilituus lipolyticus TaxID=2491017 RepID=A0A502KQS1_9GAMM|nr:BlaI/MecI/CopY family transcriptional regulator [Litorilituus lipolyticus]TPH12575.1 BlaI/MecI/CopY family transcriptional regulator [Litorilituus lipolyticus]
MKEISKAEFEVLSALWEKYPASANDLISTLNVVKPWHDKTVKTLLNRLVKKEAVGFQKEQRKYLYFPLIEKEAYTQYESKSLIERLFSGRVSPLIAGFAKNQELKKEDISQLKEIISQWEKEND